MAMFRDSDGKLIRHSIKCDSEETAKKQAKLLKMDAVTITEMKDSSWTLSGYIPNDDTLDKIKATVPNNHRAYAYSLNDLTQAIEVPMNIGIDMSSEAYDAHDSMIAVMGSAIRPNPVNFHTSGISNQIDEAIDKTVREFADKMTQMQDKYETALKIITMQADKLKMLEDAGTYKGDIIQSLEDITIKIDNLDKRVKNIEYSYVLRDGPVIKDLQNDCHSFRGEIREISKLLATNSGNIIEMANVIEEFITNPKSEESVTKSDSIEEKTEI